MAIMSIPLAVDRNYRYKSVATQIPRDAGLALIPLINLKFHTQRRSDRTAVESRKTCS